MAQNESAKYNPPNHKRLAGLCAAARRFWESPGGFRRCDCSEPDVHHYGLDYTLRFDPGNKVLLVTLGKVVTKATALAIYHAALRLVASQGPCSGIADCSAVEQSEITAGFVRALSSMIPTLPPQQLEIFVANRPFLYGLSRMFQMLPEGKGSVIQVVESLDSAFALLDLDSPDFRLIEQN